MPALLVALNACCDSSSPSAPSPATHGPAATAPSAATPVTATAPEGAEAWAGRYSASWVSGGKAGDATPVVSYDVTVRRVGERYDVAVSADGFQTMKRMKGEGAVSTDGRELAVRFASCEPDDMFQCNGYAKGDTLFTLRRDSKALWLRFGKMTSPDEKAKQVEAKKAPG
jgi:Family of unknown function (DUF5991)